ncbi:TetR/AcrR family transcriptional regulator [Klebsiella oxytoca]|uniref:TetR family transcriptional regulator n=1 Tax=Klebsiella oxytoca TaxID=571 RepID=A0A6B8MIB5_KLEOX|nr:TetR/AcrR family transcriptional regulator [Klebsiella oxytoca]QGN37285.1 TetR family transcriptional regulator [Klebsiella oxytoca]
MTTKNAVTRGRPRDFDRDEALEKALETFWQYGYEASSLALLKTAMGINSPSLYAAFGSKNALFTEAVTFYLAKYGAYREKALQSAKSAREGIAALFEQTLTQFYADQRHRGCFVVLAALLGSQDSAPIRAILNEERRRTALLFERRLMEECVAGDPAARQQAYILAEYFTTVLFGLSVQVRDGVSEHEVRAVVELALSVFDRHGEKS